MKFFLFITFLVFSNVCFAGSLVSSETATAQPKQLEPFEAPEIEEDEPLEIRSERVDLYRKKGEIHFINDVKAVQGDMTILSNKMIVEYTEDKNSKISIDRILVKGGASLFTKTIKASGNSGLYDFKKGNVSLKGDVIANEQGAMAYGDEFIYNVNTKKTSLIGGNRANERVIIILDDIEELEERVNETKEQDEETK